MTKALISQTLARNDVCDGNHKAKPTLKLVANQVNHIIKGKS